MAETTYKVFEQRDLTYAIKVKEPGRPVRVVGGFKTQAEAESWITAEMMAGPRSGEKRAPKQR